MGSLTSSILTITVDSCNLNIPAQIKHTWANIREISMFIWITLATVYTLSHAKRNRVIPTKIMSIVEAPLVT